MFETFRVKIDDFSRPQSCAIFPYYGVHKLEQASTSNLELQS